MKTSPRTGRRRFLKIALSGIGAGLLPACGGASFPISLSVSSITSRSIALAWTTTTSIAGLAGYEVVRDGVLLARLAANRTGFSDSALAANTPYAYAVRAVNAAGAILATADITPTTTGWPVLAGDPGVAAYRSGPGAARILYVDARSGDDLRDGLSTATAWKSLDRLRQVRLGPGDVVRLARNSVWLQQNIYLDGANGTYGTLANPVVFEAYGQGLAPTITDPRAPWDKSKSYAAIVVGAGVKYVHFLDLRINDTRGEVGVVLHRESQGIVLGNLEILRCSTAIAVAGTAHSVLSCYIHDVNQGNGGIGIKFEGADLEFAWNRLAHCVTVRQDGTKDGAPFEFYGRSVDAKGVETYTASDNIQIHHNLVDSCLNFIEAYGNATRMMIAYNLYVNSPANPLIFHLDDCEHPSWTHECTYELSVENNTFAPSIEASPGGWGAYGLLVDWDHPADPTKSRMVVRNNLLVTNHTALSWINPLAGNLVHDHNFFQFIAGGRFCTNTGVWVQDATEWVGDPLFVDRERGDYRLSRNSPAIGKGAPASYRVDLAGTPIPADKACDIGAFAFKNEA